MRCADGYLSYRFYACKRYPFCWTMLCRFNAYKNTPTYVEVLVMDRRSRRLLLLQHNPLLTLTGEDIEEQIQEYRHEASCHDSIIGEDADRFGHF